MYKNTITACTLFIRFTLFILLALLKTLLTLTLFYKLLFWLLGT